MNLLCKLGSHPHLVLQRWVHLALAEPGAAADDGATPPWEVADPHVVTRTTKLTDGSALVYRHDLSQLRDRGGEQRDAGVLRKRLRWR